MIESIIQDLKQIMVEELDVNLKKEEIDENTALLDGDLGVDSIAIVELISSAEDKFNIEFSDSDLVPENFATLTILANLIEQKITVKSPS